MFEISSPFIKKFADTVQDDPDDVVIDFAESRVTDMSGIEGLMFEVMAAAMERMGFG